MKLHWYCSAVVLVHRWCSGGAFTMPGSTVGRDVEKALSTVYMRFTPPYEVRTETFRFVPWTAGSLTTASNLVAADDVPYTPVVEMSLDGRAIPEAKTSMASVRSCRHTWPRSTPTRSRNSWPPAGS